MEEKRRMSIVLEARNVKRLSKKIKTEFFILKPGEIWLTSYNGERISITADKTNTSNLYIGAK